MPARKRRVKKDSIDINELKKVHERDARQFATLYDIGQSLTSTLDLNKALNLITEKVANAMRSDVCILRLLEGKSRLVLKSSYGINNGLHALKKDIRIGECIEGKVAKKNQAIIIKDITQDAAHINKGLTKQKSLMSLLSVPLVEMSKTIGVFSVYSRKKDFYSNDDKRTLALFAYQAIIAIENARLFEKTRSNYINTMRFFASIIDAKDAYTGNHSNRVMRNAIRLAEKLRLTNRQKEILRYASLLHDIGKISIDTSILTKPGPLTDEEWKQIVKHPVVGSTIIKKIGFLDDLIPVVMYHHERYEGGGYPDSDMKGKEIPLEARILAVVDAYEAMTADRPYRKALSKQEAIKELKGCAGTQFDPEIVSIFLDILKRSE